MLSIGTIRGNGEYYLDLASEDYYLEGGEHPGLWLGSAASFFALGKKKVRDEQLKQLLDGFSPIDKSQKLVGNAGKEKRQRGHDFTFSAPKSVSIAWAIADSRVRAKISMAQLKAVQAAINYLEKHATFTRRGKGGAETERAKLLVAAFEHSASRAGDMHLHTHALIANVCQRFDSTTGTLFGSVKHDQNGKVIETLNPLFRHKMAAGAVYQLTLAHEMEMLVGFKTRKSSQHSFSFELDCISDKTIEKFSTRSEEIQRATQQKGFVSAKSKAIANLETRDSKPVFRRQELHERWKGEIAKSGITKEFLSEQIKDLAKQRHSKNLGKEIAKAALKITEQKGSFELKELYQALATELQTHPVSYRKLEQAVEKELFEGDLVSLGVDNLDLVVSTQAVLKQEQQFIDLLEESRNNHEHSLEIETLNQTLIENTDSKEEPTLSADQERALRYLTSKNYGGPGAIKVLTGDAGTGKTTVLKTARKAWDKEGYRVYGACLSGKASDELESKSGIESYTLAKWNHELGQSFADNLQHHRKMLARAAIGKQTWTKSSHPEFDSKSVLVIDEAAMADTLQLLPLVKNAREKGALVILVGDEKQCQAIGHGGAFLSASRTLGTERLTENWRQQQPEDQRVAALIADGKSAEALKNLAKRGKVIVAKSERQAMSDLVKNWKKEGARSPGGHQIFVSTNQQRQEVNALCQKERWSLFKSALGTRITNFEGQCLYSGDRISFRQTIQCRQPMVHKKNNSFETIRRGAFGTILSINLKTQSLRVKLDDGRNLVVPLKIIRQEKRRYAFGQKEVRVKTPIALGYATTTHAGQGATIDHVYVLAGGPMQNRELSYVQLTRARFGTQLYTSKEQAGKELTDIASGRDPEKSYKKEDTIERSLLARQLRKQQIKELGLQRQYPERMLNRGR